jgi:hypothetical protein
MPTIVNLAPQNDCPEMQDSLQARVHDPLWLLARQWQFGEFKGDDAGSPASAQLVVRSALINRLHAGPLPSDPAQARAEAEDYSPSTVPLETLVEREPIQRPVRSNLRLAAETGLHFLRILAAQQLGTYRALYRTAFPMQATSEAERPVLDDDTLRFLGIVGGRGADGLQLYGRLVDLRQGSGLDGLFADAPFNTIRDEDRARVVQAMTAWLAWLEALFSQSAENRSWEHDRLEYTFAVSGQTTAGETVLRAPEYLEGHLDWFSFVVDPAAELGATGDVQSTKSTFLPSPVSFRGMPAPRLWEFEDGNVNFDRIEASPQDLARLLLVEFGLIYGNDWFVVPVEIEAGSLCRIGALVIVNTFGERMLISSSSQLDGPASPWRMFVLSPTPAPANGSADPATTARIQDLFFLPPVIGTVLEATAVEEVLLLRDEMANLAWAVERVVESASNRPLDRFEAFQEKVRRREALEPPDSSEAPSGAALTYRLGTSVPDYWIPLLPVRVGNALWLKRGALPRVTSGGIEGTFEPQGLILDPGRDLLLPDEEVPREGARVTRGYQYVRWVDGSTHLWIGRRKEPGRGEGSSGLRFDIAE